MGNNPSIQKFNFEDIQDIIKHNERYILINTMVSNNQDCLIPTTIHFKQEEHVLNQLLTGNTDKVIVIYGKNSNDMTIYNKYDQLIKLGFKNVYIYPGGMFEWLCLQDIYGEELFPTSKKELDILKYKAPAHFSVKNYYLTDM